MASRRTSNRGRSSAPRRRLFWARYTDQVVFGTGNLAAIANVLQPFETAYGADLFGFTVTRVVGHFSMAADTTATAGTPSRFSMGLRVEGQADISGLTDAEQVARIPLNDPFEDWMFARNQDSLSGSSANAAQNYNTSRFDLDLRSQRRLDELGQSLYLFTGVSNTAPAVGGTMSWDLNVLCKRP